MSAPTSSPETRAATFPWFGKVALLLAVAAFELHVVSLIPHIRQSEQYRRRYITGTSECYVTDDLRRAFIARRPQPSQIDMQGIDTRLFCTYMPDGWHRPQNGKAVSIGPRSLLTLPAPPAGGRILLDLTAPASLHYPLVVSIRQGDRLLYQGRMMPGQRDSIAVTPDLAASEGGIVPLTMDRSYDAGGRHVGRKRRLAMRVELTRIRYAPR